MAGYTPVKKVTLMRNILTNRLGLCGNLKVCDIDTIKVREWQDELISCREIADRLGHESVKTTLDTCSLLYPDKDQQLADRLNQFRRTVPTEENP